MVLRRTESAAPPPRRPLATAGRAYAGTSVSNRAVPLCSWR